MNGSVQVSRSVSAKKIVSNPETQGPVQTGKEVWTLASSLINNSTTKLKKSMPKFTVEAPANLKFPVKFHSLTNFNLGSRLRWISRIQPILKSLC